MLTKNLCSGNEIGPFRAIEESTLAHLSPASVRPDIFAWYSLVGTAGVAFGTLSCGWMVHTLQSLHGWDDVRSYRIVFLAYAMIGVVKFFLACALSKKCEAEETKAPQRDAEATPLLANENEDEGERASKKRWALFPKISKESRAIFLSLALLFALDAFSSGLAPLSWVISFFKRKFDLEEGFLGSVFFTTSIISAASMLVAARLARKIGNVKTMVFTHLPSAICLAMLGIPNSLPLAMVFLIGRACTQSMDGPPRSAFLAAILLPNERTAIMGAINVVKTGAQSLGPLITGILAEQNLFWLSFVLAGALKACYDIGLLAVFAGYQEREEAEEE
jgi:MFS family permease